MQIFRLELLWSTSLRLDREEVAFLSQPLEISQKWKNSRLMVHPLFRLVNASFGLCHINFDFLNSIHESCWRCFEGEVLHEKHLSDGHSGQSLQDVSSFWMVEHLSEACLPFCWCKSIFLNFLFYFLSERSQVPQIFNPSKCIFKRNKKE